MKGELSDSESISMLNDIIRNNTDNSGFVMWFSSYCISCIFKPTKKSKHMYCSRWDGKYPGFAFSPKNQGKNFRICPNFNVSNCA